ncbi:hypothetical protein PC117_g21482 [Phytophthora cactorum]|uniref:Uncharacterized protein n=1 Tax=Phytophthora cactorum TaxID=29920 RepID=A0A8T1BI92_9STRA|nr:hypothetical protein PC117_g21482 [Phytophthora cactorum]
MRAIVVTCDNAWLDFSPEKRGRGDNEGRRRRWSWLDGRGVRARGGLRELEKDGVLKGDAGRTGKGNYADVGKENQIGDFKIHGPVDVANA